MTIITTTTSATLFSLLTTAQRKLAETNRPKGSAFTVELYNPDTVKRVFWEIGAAATTSSRPIAINGGSYKIDVYDLAKINLICETTDTAMIVQIY